MTKRLSRRQVVGGLGAVGAAALLGSGRGTGFLGGLGDSADTAQAAEASASQLSCVLTPSKTEGPYFVDERLNRSDIRIDTSDGSVQSGVPLRLDIRLLRSDGDCAPVQGATVDVWHAAPNGTYSDVAQNGTSGKKYLRGYQASNADGLARFQTVYPGWYTGRAVHIHFKVRFFDGSSETYEFTSQIFFSESVNDQVMGQAPYNTRGARDTRNSTDNIYGGDGSQLTATVTSDGSGGYVATLTAGLSGLPSSGSSSGSDSRVKATLESARIRRTRTGGRVLKLKLDVDETVSVDARVLRGSRTIARKRLKKLGAGTRRPRMKIKRSTHAGAARLKLTLKDKAGNTKVIRRRLNVPRRKLSKG